MARIYSNENFPIFDLVLCFAIVYLLLIYLTHVVPVGLPHFTSVR